MVSSNTYIVKTEMNGQLMGRDVDVHPSDLKRRVWGETEGEE